MIDSHTAPDAQVNIKADTRQIELQSIYKKGSDDAA